jgi:predicted RND superfamily exporter protein
MHYMLRLREDGERRIPASSGEVSRVVDRYQLVRGETQLRELLDPTLGKGLITVFLKEANFVDTARLMEAAREYERRELAPRGISLDFAGDVAVSQAMVGGIVQTQLRSLLLSLIGIAVLTSLMFRSLVWGLMCVLPAGLAVLVIFSSMGWSGVPLGVATSMFAAIVLGIGVDYAIHLLERIRRLLDDGHGLEGALEGAVERTAPAIVADTLAVGMAFGLLCFSRVPANAWLGATVGLALIVCLLVALTLLPVVVRFLRQGFEGEFHSRGLREEAVAIAAGGTTGWIRRSE